jgi:hypothetical protein
MMHAFHLIGARHGRSREVWARLGGAHVESAEFLPRCDLRTRRGQIRAKHFQPRWALAAVPALRCVRAHVRYCVSDGMQSRVPVLVWQARVESRCRSKMWEGGPSSGADVAAGEPSPGADVAADGSEPSPGADVAGVSPVPVQMWQAQAQSRCRCGRGGPSPGADVGGASPVLVQMWQARAQSRCRCGRRGPSPGADVAGAGGRTVFSESKYLSSASWSTNHRFFQLRLHAVTAQFWCRRGQMWAQSRCRRGQVWAQSRCRRGRGEPAKSTFPLTVSHTRISDARPCTHAHRTHTYGSRTPRPSRPSW